MPSDPLRDDNLLAIPLSAEIRRRLCALAASRGETVADVVRAHLSVWVGDWGSRVVPHVVRPGETLQAIAVRYYGDGRQSAVIAAYNDLVDATRLGAGDVLLVPEPTEDLSLPAGESPYLVGLHDRGGEYLFERAGRSGWVVIDETIGCDRADWSSASYSDLAGRGCGVIVCLRHGADGRSGTLPPAGKYADFARRCGNYCERSSGCHLWVIGNEPNAARERPGGARQGEPILPSAYAAAFRACRDEIRSRPGHDADQVITAAVAPWNTQTAYPGNVLGDWVLYLADVLAELGESVDGVALHTSTHGADPTAVSRDEHLPHPFAERQAGFRAYRDFLAAVPEALGGLPVYITEADQGLAWEDSQTGWVEAAYREIAGWNLDPTHQTVRALVLYRWARQAGAPWHIEGKREVLAELEVAMRLGYRWYPGPSGAEQAAC